MSMDPSVTFGQLRGMSVEGLSSKYSIGASRPSVAFGRTSSSVGDPTSTFFYSWSGVPGGWMSVYSGDPEWSLVSLMLQGMCSTEDANDYRIAPPRKIENSSW